MKNIFRNSIIAASMALILAGCSTPTMVSSSWRKPNATANNFHNIFIAAITKETSTKQNLETGLQTLLQQKGLTVEKSIDVFPPTFSTQTGRQRDLVLGKIQGTNADGILTVTILRKETESRYVQGSGGGFWNPGLRYGYYNRFWSYYNNYSPMVYSPGYYDETKVYYIETNLYNARNEELIWAAQTRTYDPTSINSFLKGYVDAIYDRMVKDGLITAAVAERGK